MATINGLSEDDDISRSTWGMTPVKRTEEIPEDEKAVRRIKTVLASLAPSLPNTTSSSLALKTSTAIEGIQADKVQAAARPVLPQEELRVEESLVPSAHDALLSMDKEHLHAVEEGLAPEKLQEVENRLADIKTDSPDEPNYVIRLQNVIGKLLAQFSKIGEKDRLQKRDLEARFSSSNKKWGEYQREMGDRGMNFTWIALGLMVGQLFLPQADQAIVGFFAKEGCTNLSSMFNSETQSRQKQVDALSQLAMSEINAMMQKDQSAASNKEKFEKMITDVVESLKRAAQAG